VSFFRAPFFHRNLLLAIALLPLATTPGRAQQLVSENFDTGVTFSNWYWTGGFFVNPPNFNEAWNQVSTGQQFFTTSFASTSLNVGDVMTSTFLYNPNSTNISSVRVGLFSGTAPTTNGWAQFNATNFSQRWTGYTGTLAVLSGNSAASLKTNTNSHAFFGATNGSSSVAESFGTGELRWGGLVVTRLSNSMVVTLLSGDISQAGTNFGSLTPLVTYTDTSSSITDFNIFSFYTTTPSGNVDMRYDTVRVGLSNAVAWSGAGSGWLTSSNWLSGVAPGASSVAQFGTNAPASVGIDMALNSGAQTAGAIELTAARNSALVVSNSSTSAAGTLTLSGINVAGTSNVVVRNASAHLLTVTNGAEQQLGLVLGNSTNNIVRVDGAGGVTIASSISGEGRILTKAGVGAGALTLGGSNTFSGGVNLETGTLRLENASALGTGTLTQSVGTTLQVATTGTIANEMSLRSISVLTNVTLTGAKTLQGTAYQVSTGAAAVEEGLLSGAGSLTKTGAGTLILSGANTYTGATTVGGGTLRIDSNARLGNPSATLTLSNAGVLQVTAAGQLSNAITIGAGNGVLANASSGALVVSGGVVKDGTVFTSRSDAGTNIFTGVISGASANSDLVVDGGTTVFSNVMTYNGPTIITNGGTLVLAVDNAMPFGSDLILGGGTFRVGVETYNASAALALGTLTLTADSTIDLGGFGTSGDRNLVFADSSAITWAGTLTITNWQGATRTQSDVTRLLFGTGGLTTTQLGQIYFADQNVNGGVLIEGELAPIPEAPVVWGAVAITAVIFWRERRRLKSLFAGMRD